MRSIVLINLTAFILGCVSANPAEPTTASKVVTESVSENHTDKYRYGGSYRGGNYGGHRGYNYGGHYGGHRGGSYGGHYGGNYGGRHGGRNYKRDEVATNEPDVNAYYSLYRHGGGYMGDYGECDEGYPSGYGGSRGNRGH
ncbi:hypothetical protein BGX26_002045 [Mortierella sp. AD094]|nr:hypothetical protein BGX26_002045 [Mortierella sp. AD094]